MLFIIVSYFVARKARNLRNCGFGLMAVFVGLSMLIAASQSGPGGAGAALVTGSLLSLLTVWLPIGIIKARRPRQFRVQYTLNGVQDYFIVSAHSSDDAWLAVQQEVPDATVYTATRQ